MQFVKRGPDIPESLLQAHEDSRVVFFCGAGISYPAGLPGFHGLVEKIYSRLQIDRGPVQETAIRAKRYDTALGVLEAQIADGRRTVRNAIAEILNPQSLTPHTTATHDALLTLAKCRDNHTRLITTNFDRLFEHVIANGSTAVERFEAPLLPVPKYRWDGLVYLHGLLPEEPTGKTLDNLVVSSGDFGLAYLTERWAARFVSELLRNFVVCFVGYSIDDPVLRYMMDALAADRLLGESTEEMFAFGSYSKGQETTQANEWRAKNVTPILYREHWHHAYLHRTLQVWARTHRDGTRGKERIVVEYASAHPDTATRQDDFVNRMLWALSDPTGLPAKQFADMNPVPSLAWLEPICEPIFHHADLVRFGIPPKTAVDETLAFSLTHRPAPYDLAAPMVIADSGAHGTRHDDVMHHLTCWLMRHLNDPALLLWFIKQGGTLRSNLELRLAYRLDELARMEQCGEIEELERIRRNAPAEIPDTRMRILWGLFLAGRIKMPHQDADLYRWRGRFEREGLTTTLRLELCAILTPKVSLRPPFPWPLDDDEDEEPRRIHQLVDWDIVLTADNVHWNLHELEETDTWADALPTLLADFTNLLRDALDLMKELGSADDKSDLSYVNQPFITEHPQNSQVQDWTALIELNRNAWQALVSKSPEQARLAAETWSHITYPLFRRLTFFTAAQADTVPSHKALQWLLADDNWWLWSNETRNEAMQLITALAPRLSPNQLRKLERAILAGPPRDMYRPDIDEEDWNDLKDRETWLRLIRISQAGATLNAAARRRQNELSASHPDWDPLEEEPWIYTTWAGDLDELLPRVTTPRDPEELVEWLRSNPEPDGRQQADWRDRCRDHLDTAASALIALAEEGNWPVARWEEALLRWSEDGLTHPSWLKLAPVLANIPANVLHQLARPVSLWLEKLSRIIEEHEETFLSLCSDILAFDHPFEDSEQDSLDLAIRHPIGNVTQALLRWWYRKDLQDGQGLDHEPKGMFTEICDTNKPWFRPGRALLALHVISLFRVDPDWTTQFVLPLFEWKNNEAEARSAWQAFLWSPRLHGPLMAELKPTFLDTANRCSQLGEYGRQYASLLAYVGLEPEDVFRTAELRAAMQRLPQEELEHAAETFYRTVNAAGEQRADYWRNRVTPFLKSIWPKTTDKISEAISRNFSLASIAAGQAFPEALRQVHPWLKPLQFPDQITRALQRAGLHNQFPEEALDLLHRIFPEQARGHFPNLADCLRTIKNAQPELSRDHRFQRLLDIQRANTTGPDPDSTI